MYLKTLQIKNFRCIEDTTLEFNKGLNVIIGENNTGKSTVIDALRLSFSIGLQRREIFLSPDDFFINRDGVKADKIEFHLVFSDISEEQRGVFVEMLSINDKNKAELKLHIRYELINRDGIEKIKFRYWGGDNEGKSIPYELMGLFYFVYLGALRNAEKDLRPGRGNRLGQLFMKLEGDKDKQKKYAESLNGRIRKIRKWVKLINKANSKVNNHLNKISILSEPQAIGINFLPLEFRKIVENMKMFIPFGSNKSQIQFEIWQNGLGYNNLIYIATVLGDLLERNSVEKEAYIALLLEEPEAHLHPQLQDVLFNYFKEMENQNIQIFITSHSPTITAKTDINSTIVLYKQNNKILNLSVRKCPMEDKYKKYLERFLDVTKSQLFFAKGVILVEGISEALLMPVFADIMGEEYNLDKNGIEVVNISGVAFEPFAKLFNSDNVGERLNIKCAIITDDDRKSGKTLPSRAQKAKNLEKGQLKVFLANYTFEYELYNADKKNGSVIIETYKAIHPRFKINKEKDMKEQAKEFVKKIKNNGDKAEFAQELARKLFENRTLRNDFVVPKYIQDAIKWVIEGHE